jgi:transcriptional regulator with XRE-family HTH domain
MKKKKGLTLAQYLKKHGIKQTFLAEKLNLSPVVLCRFKTGKRGPTRKQALAIEIATNGEVPMQIWDSPSNKEGIDPKDDNDKKKNKN